MGAEGLRDWRAGQGRTGEWGASALTKGRLLSEVQGERGPGDHGGGPGGSKQERPLEATRVVHVNMMTSPRS